MLRKLLFSLALVATFGFVFAQTTTITITPSTFSGPDDSDAINKSATEATVNQTVELILPQATALHLDATKIVFDLRALDGDNWADRAAGVPYDGQSDVNWPACIAAPGADKTLQLGYEYWNQLQTQPGSTKYDAATWPNITISGTAVDTYPPIKLDSDGELVPGSKSYFVCYQSFIIQLFSNFKYWDLSVGRAAGQGVQGIEHLYVQGNTCSDFGDSTGLYALNNGATVHLIPRRTGAGNEGTTGMAAIKPGSKCNYADKSWLDVLGVLAVKVNSDYHGPSVANLTYTLMSQDTQF